MWCVSCSFLLKVALSLMIQKIYSLSMSQAAMCCECQNSLKREWSYRHWTLIFIFNPFPKHRTYFCVSPPQMALLGFFHAVLSLASPVTGMPLTRVKRALEERENARWGTQEGRKHNCCWSCPGFTPRPPAWQASALPLRYAILLILMCFRPIETEAS